MACRTMDDILDFTRDMSSRSAYQKLLHKSDDATAVKALDMRLTHAFQLFEVRDMIIGYPCHCVELGERFNPASAFE